MRVENNPQMLDLIDGNEMTKIGASEILKEVNMRHEYLQDYATTEPLIRYEEEKSNTQI
jgi:hypothetical protein